MKIDDLTLLVFVRDRHYNLSRIGRYYNDLDCKKIVFDTSKVKYTNVSMLENAGFEYIYEGPTPYPEVFYKASKLVETEFVVDSPDDDISLKQCVEFLRENKDYSACDGEFVWLDPANRALFTKHPNKFFGQLKRQFYSTSPMERLKFLFTCTMSKNSSVIRTETFKLIYKIFDQNPQYRPICFNDRIFAYITAVEGNIKTLPLVYQVRSHTPADSLQQKACNDKELAEELKQDVRMIDYLDEYHLKPVVDLLIEKEKDISFESALQTSIKLLKDQLESSGDACCTDTSEWPERDGRHRKEYANDVSYICQLMLDDCVNK